MAVDINQNGRDNRSSHPRKKRVRIIPGKTKARPIAWRLGRALKLKPDDG